MPESKGTQQKKANEKKKTRAVVSETENEQTLKTRYNPAIHDRWAWSLAIKGATIEDIARAFEVSKRTVERWMYTGDVDEEGNKVLTSFGEMLNTGRDAANANVEYSLYQRATGIHYTETEVTVVTKTVKNPDTGKEESVEVPVRVKESKKFIPPETSAIIYYLNNRTRGKPDGYTSRQDVNIESDLNKVDLSKLTTEQLLMLVEMGEKAKEAEQHAEINT